MNETALAVYLVQLPILAAVMLATGIWWRFPLFALLIPAQFIKYMLWDFWQPAVYLWVETPVMLLKIGACLEAFRRRTEFMEQDARKWLFRFCGFVGITLVAVIFAHEVAHSGFITAFITGRIYAHVLCFGFLGALWGYSWKRPWREFSPGDGLHCLFLALLCGATALTDIATTRESSTEEGFLIFNLYFRVARNLMCALWIWLFARTAYVKRLQPHNLLG